MFLYVAGPYRGDVERNISRAAAVAANVYRSGHVAIVPHLQTKEVSTLYDAPERYWLATTMAMLQRCDGMVLVEGWQNSEGTLKELDFAIRRAMPIFIDDEIYIGSSPILGGDGSPFTVYKDGKIPPCQMEVSYPSHCRDRLDSFMQMYRTSINQNSEHIEKMVELGARP